MEWEKSVNKGGAGIEKHNIVDQAAHLHFTKENDAYKTPQWRTK
jgi:hypothetical protein